jgi:hypothetical protein
MNRKKIIFFVVVIVVFSLVVILVNTHNNPNDKGVIGNILSGNILTSGTITTTSPSGSTVTKETPSTTKAATDGFIDSAGVWHDTTQPGQSSGPFGGPGRSTVFPDNDRGMININYNDKNGPIDKKAWFPGDIGSYTNSPYGNPFNHLFPVDSTGKPADPSDVISYATTSAYGTLPPQSEWNKHDKYKYTDRPNMPLNTGSPTNTTSAYGNLPSQSEWRREYKYTDRPNMPSNNHNNNNNSPPSHTSSAYGNLPSHGQEDWMYTDRPVI